MRKFIFLAVLVIGCSLVGRVLATPPVLVVPEEAPSSQPSTLPASAGVTGPGEFLAAIPRSSYLLGNLWGLRPWLSKYGVSLTISETSEVLGNVSGGVTRGFDYDGLTQMDLQLDTQRAFG